LFLLAFVTFASASNTYGSACNTTNPCNLGLQCYAGLCKTDYGKYGYPCTTNANCNSYYQCIGGFCSANPGTYGAPCQTATCLSDASAGSCLASSECKQSTGGSQGVYYCQPVNLTAPLGTLNYCLNGNGYTLQLPDSHGNGGVQGYPCIPNTTGATNCSAAFTCANDVNTTNYYGQPVCVWIQASRANADNGWCLLPADCQYYFNTLSNSTYSVYRCSSSAYYGVCGRASCDIVLQQCQTMRSTSPQVWANANCYPTSAAGASPIQMSGCTSTPCNCGN